MEFMNLFIYGAAVGQILFIVIFFILPIIGVVIILKTIAVSLLGNFNKKKNKHYGK